MLKRKYIDTIEKAKRFIKFRILHVNDSPHRISLGLALGLFIAFTPALGLHIVSALVLAFILRANKFLTLTAIWVTNPFTMVPIYYANYCIGKFVMSLLGISENSYAVQDQQILKYFSSYDFFRCLFRAGFWHEFFEFVWVKGRELWVGSVLVGFAAALTAYIATYLLIVWYRKKYPHLRYL
jgi:uncharacterized protein (DUF2062 family)